MSTDPMVLFHEPDPTEAGLSLAQATKSPGSTPASRTPSAASAKTPHERKKRARKVGHETLSSVISFDTQWRLSLYCAITGYGVKDAVTKAAMGRLGIGLYPKPLRASQINAVIDDVPYVEGDTTPRISVQMRDPDLMDQIRRDIEDLNGDLDDDARQVTMSSWTADALDAFFNHLRLPSRVSD
ncbi:hypothetical protein AB0K18_43135 [Nonomuraea sp. NPDC049421]|uniref:hypothetical protein n=1 Tax=Nonomuraea sp. NPDC049421 TaxID=3155275 RepID=UPI003425C3D9